MYGSENKFFGIFQLWMDLQNQIFLFVTNWNSTQSSIHKCKPSIFSYQNREVVQSGRKTHVNTFSKLQSFVQLFAFYPAILSLWFIAISWSPIHTIQHQNLRFMVLDLLVEICFWTLDDWLEEQYFDSQFQSWMLLPVSIQLRLFAVYCQKKNAVASCQIPPIGDAWIIPWHSFLLSK